MCLLILLIERDIDVRGIWVALAKEETVWFS
jgi:hypothetical protein